MTISLDGMDLPDLVMEDEFSQNRVEARVKRTLGGLPNIWEQKNSEKNIDLVGGRDFGWIGRDVLVRLQDLAAEANAFYTLSYDGTEYTVRFRPEDGAPIEATPVIPRPNQADGDWYCNVRIRLMEI